MSCKPIIGLNAELKPAEKDRHAITYISSGYYDSILRAGGVPVILPPFQDEADLVQVLDLVDGFVLVGGPDLDPRRDGFALHPSVKMMSQRREDFDRLLIQSLADRRIPTFGIGAGMQLLNVAMGGNLFLHIPEDCPSALRHFDPIDAAHRHTLSIAAGSLMERVYGDGEIRVNSMHHMAIDELAPGFTVTARCPDGIIEAIESRRSDWFAMGTQFHPESTSATALDIRVFEEFLASVISESPRVRMVA